MKIHLQETVVRMERRKRLPNLRQLVLLALLALAILNFTDMGTKSVDAAEGDVAQISPGKVLPQNYNHYLGTNDVQVQLEFSRAIVLQETMGDLVFNVTTLARRRTIAIYVPYEFGIRSNLTYIWSSVTNDYRFISLSRLSDRDPIAPNWWRILVSNGTTSISPGSHYIRVFNVTAPSIVGRYFFKIFTDGTSIGAKNFPTLVVSADPNPAYITGTVLDGSSDLSRYGHPIQLQDPEGGKVVAEGITPEGRIVVAQTFFNASAKGRYTLYGLAPGSYLLTVSAAGYSNTTKADPVRVLAGQSLAVDLFARPSPRIEGTVWSKCGGLPQPWGPITTQVGPGFGAALAYVGTGIFPGRDLIYALRGADTSDFLRYDTIVGEWEHRRPTPGSVGAGGSLAFDGVQYIYALQGGGSDVFWRYDIAGDSWQVMPSQARPPAPIGEGGSIAFNSDDGSIYAVRGGGSTDFWRYVPSVNTWEILAQTPAPIGGGGSLIFNPNDGRLYALRGIGTADFWRYDPQTDTWEILSAAPATVTSGASLAFNLQDGFIYALTGGATTDFLRYSPPPANVWSPRASLPSSVGPGGSLTFDSEDGLVYALVGAGSSSFFAYHSALDSWTGLTSFPLIYPRPITVEILDSLNESKRLLPGFADPASERFDFSDDGSTEFDGHIPQDGSGYISGIVPGLYKVKVWVNRYVQLEETQIQLIRHEALARIQFDVQRTGRAEILVYFKDLAQLKQATQVDQDRTLTVELYDHDEVLRGQNSTRVTAGSTSKVVVITGFLGTLRDYGLPADTYSVRVAIDGFYQPSDAFTTILGCNARVEMSLEVIRTGSLILSVRSVNSQLPQQLENWRYPGAPIRVEVRDLYGVEISEVSVSRQRPFTESVELFVTGLRTGTYSIHVFTFGYVQTGSYLVSVVDGTTTDVAVNVVLGGILDLTIDIEKEDVFTAIDTYPFSFRVPIRIEVRDALDQFVAANATYVSSDATTLSFRLAGFRSYAGNSAWRWINYYDTADGVLQRDYGLGPGSYTFIVYLPGFSQTKTTVTAMLPEAGVSSVVFHLNRLAHLFGRINSFNMFDELVPLNWAMVDAVGAETRDFTSTLDGSYDMWLKEGHYLAIYSLNGYQFIAREVQLPKGSDIPINLYLQPISLSIAEFGSSLWHIPALLAIIWTAAILLRKRNKDQMKALAGIS